MTIKSTNDKEWRKNPEQQLKIASHRSSETIKELLRSGTKACFAALKRTGAILRRKAN